jgi:hypothetical protein
MFYGYTERISNLGRVNGQIITVYPAVEAGLLKGNSEKATG